MRIYQFHLYDRRGRRPMLDFSDCPDDREAARAALGCLQQHRTCDGVEVYDGERFVLRLERPGQGPGEVHAPR